ncbi:MAG: Fur family transcriptional regulator [Christensenellales bacterium]|jgi:Fur family peroxide stress response transcriptional regulator
MIYSRQRELIYGAVKHRSGHPTADEVFTLLKPDNPSLSIATVYRNLNQLSQMGRLVKIPIAKGADRFDASIHPHHHLICERCGAVVDLPASVMPDFREQRIAGCRITGMDAIFHGICPRCAAEET